MSDKRHNEGNPNPKRIVSGDINVHGEVEIREPSTLVENKIKNEAKSSKRDEVRLKIEIITVILVAIYASLTFWQACNTQTAIRLTREQFSDDQRPYLWVASQAANGGINVTTSVPVDAAPLSIEIWYSDYGKSPAIVTGFSTDAEIGPAALGKLHVMPWHPISLVLPPGKADPYRIHTAQTINPANVDAAFPIAIYINIRYRDMKGREFESDLCFTKQNINAGLDYCTPDFKFKNQLIDCDKEKSCQAF